MCECVYNVVYADTGACFPHTHMYHRHTTRIHCYVMAMADKATGVGHIIWNNLMQ